MLSKYFMSKDYWIFVEYIQFLSSFYPGVLHHNYDNFCYSKNSNTFIKYLYNSYRLKITDFQHLPS